MGQIDGGLRGGGEGEGMVPCILCESLHLLYHFQYTWNDEYFSFFFHGQVRKNLRNKYTYAHRENKG